MQTTINSYMLDIPQTDLSFMRQLVKRMGWTMRSVKKSKTVAKKNGIDMALDDIKNGRVYKADSSDDMLQQILG